MNPQISRSPFYLVRNPYSYCFRMFVPEDLQSYIGRKELRYSLKTGYLGIAKHKARVIAGQVQLIFKFLRKGNKSLEKLSDHQIQEIVQKYLKEYIDSIEERMYADDPPTYTIDTRHFYQYVNELDDIKQEIVEYLGTLDYRTVESIVDDLLKENGIENIDKSSVSYQKLCRGILKAQLKGIDIEKKQMGGDYSDDEDVGSPIPSKKNVMDSDSKLLSEVIEKYVLETKVNWKDKTESTHMATLKLLEEIIGAVPIQSITRKRVGEFKEVLKKLPQIYGTIRKFEIKPFLRYLRWMLKKIGDTYNKQQSSEGMLNV